VRIAHLFGGVRRLSWADRVEFVHAVLIVGCVEVGLRASSLPRILKVLRVNGEFEVQQRGSPMEDSLPSWALRRIELARLALRWAPTRSTCLRIALVSASRLRRLDPKVRIGVARGEEGILAHAWLEIDGRYFDPSAADFEPVHSLAR
jgi:hypothetical protein